MIIMNVIIVIIVWGPGPGITVTLDHDQDRWPAGRGLSYKLSRLRQD